DPNDPEQITSVVSLDDNEARQVGGIIGGMTYTPRALQSLEVAFGEMVIDWFRVEPHFATIGKTIGELQLRQKSGASVIAIVGPANAKTLNPGPGDAIEKDSVLVIIGTRENVTDIK